MGALVHTVNDNSPCNLKIDTSKLRGLQTKTKKLLENTNNNIDMGSQSIPIIKEGRGIIEGIKKGDTQNITKNAGLLGLYTCGAG